MTASVETLNQLLSTNGIRVRRGRIFDRLPSPLPASFDFGRTEGMMLGLAIGDALGNTSEGIWPEDRRRRFGEIRDYLPHPYFRDRRGYPSDDTQLAFWTLEQLLWDGSFDPARVARRFTQGEIFGVGQTVREFVVRFVSGLSWQECGPRSAGNGALMRIAPILIPHLREPSQALWADTALCAMVTHNDSAAIASCVAFVSVLWDLLGMDRPPEPRWWLERFVEVLRDLECDDTYQPRSPHLAGYRGNLWALLEEEVNRAWEQGVSTLDACNRWYSGAYLLETVPSVIYILMRHGHEPEEAVVRAINDTVDNDTTGAVVGSAMGALHGREALPRRWVEGLSGRLGMDDDGRVFELLAQAEERF